MISALGCFLLAAVLAALLTPLVERVAVRRRLFESADGHLKVHEGAIPRVGGVAVVVAFYVPLLSLFALGTGAAAVLSEDLPRFVAFCLGGLALFALGLWDDLRGAGAVAKFGVQVSVAAAAWLAGFRIEEVRLPGLGLVDLGPFGLLVTLGWIVGVTNALNLVDGLDGLAAGVAFFAALAHVAIGVLNDSLPLVLFCSALAGAVLGFLPWNFNPARIFIGDSGSLFLGFMLALTSIYSASYKSGTAVAVLGPLLILGLPILDTLLAIARRALRGVPLFDGDREHVHHRLLRLGLSQRRSVLLLYALCAAFVLAGLAATAASDRMTALVLVSLLVVLAVFERRLGFLRRGAVSATAAAPEAAREVDLLRVLRWRVEEAGDEDALWAALVEAAENLDFTRLRLETAGPARTWTRPGLPARLREGAIRVSAVVPARPGAWSAPLRLEGEKRPIRRGSSVADSLFAALLQEQLDAAVLKPAGARAVSG